MALRYWLYIIPVFIVLAILPWLPTGSVYWRDAAEFLLGAISLDIAHPPGFPTFSSLGNLFTQAPVGPLPWRIQLFGVYTTVGCLALSWCIYRELITVQENSSLSERQIIAFFIATLPLLVAPCILRQMITAEAYQLNALFSLAILYCAVRYEKKGDHRWLLSAALLSGVGLGNHPSLLFFVFPMFLLYVIHMAKKRPSNILFAIVFGLLGMSIYLYLPLRAQMHPPLNTGEPRSIERFFKLTTSARDRKLRPVTITSIGRVETLNLNTQLKITKDEGEKIINELGWHLPFLALTGIVLLALTASWRTTTLILCAVGAPLFFFRGWQPDPANSVWFLFVAIGAMSLSTVIKNQTRTMNLVTGLVLLILTVMQTNMKLPELSAQLRHKMPERMVRESLEALPYSSLLLTESSWFLGRYLQSVEGVRSDIALGYLPQVLFQPYFRPFNVQIGKNSFLSHYKRKAEEDAPDLRNLGALISHTAPLLPTYIEPAIVTNRMLAQVAHDEEHGFIRIEPNRRDLSPTQFSPLLLQANTEAETLPRSFLQADVTSFIESRAIGLVDFIFTKGEVERAISALKILCRRAELRSCSEQTYITLSRYQQIAGQTEDAKSTLENLLSVRGKSQRIAQALSDLDNDQTHPSSPTPRTDQ